MNDAQRKALQLCQDNGEIVKGKTGPDAIHGQTFNALVRRKFITQSVQSDPDGNNPDKVVGYITPLGSEALAA